MTKPNDIVGRAKTAMKSRYIQLSPNAVPLLAELIAEVEQLRALPSRLHAFGADCLRHGDMTPAAKHMLDKIADGAP